MQKYFKYFFFEEAFYYAESQTYIDVENTVQ
jgi:hypothetical protein